MNTAPFISFTGRDAFLANRDYLLTEIFNYWDASGAQDLKAFTLEFDSTYADTYLLLPSGKVAKGTYSLTPAQFTQAKLHTGAAADPQLFLHVKLADMQGAESHSRVWSGSSANDTVKITSGPEAGAFDGYYGSGGNDYFDAKLAMGSALFARPESTAVNIYGGTGFDRAAVGGNRADFTLSHGMGEHDFQLKTKAWAQTLSLRDVERLEFADQKLLLDIEGAGAKTVKLVSALFGKTAIKDKELVGKALSLFDQGYSYEKVAEAAVSETRFKTLAGSGSNGSYVNLVYKNVTGVAPSASEQAFYTQLLDSGNFTQASLSVIAAECAPNQFNVDLVGLGNTGLDYI